MSSAPCIPTVNTQSTDEVGSKKRGKQLRCGPAGNQFARKHGFYSDTWSEEEKAECEAFVRELVQDKGEHPTAAEQALIDIGAPLKITIGRAFKAMREGRGAPAHEHLLAMINSFRLIMTALGLERKQRPGQSLAEYLETKRSEADAEKTPSPTTNGTEA